MEPRRPPPPSRDPPSRRDGARPDDPPPASCHCRRGRSGRPGPDVPLAVRRRSSPTPAPALRSRRSSGPRARGRRSRSPDPGWLSRRGPAPARDRPAPLPPRSPVERSRGGRDGRSSPVRPARDRPVPLPPRSPVERSRGGRDGRSSPDRPARDRPAPPPLGRSRPPSRPRAAGGRCPPPAPERDPVPVPPRRPDGRASSSGRPEPVPVRRSPVPEEARPPESGLDVGRRPRSLSPARPSRPWAGGRGGRPVLSRRGRRSSPGEGAMIGTSLDPDATKARRRRSGPGPRVETGGVLLSQGVYPQVPSALTIFTSVFGMGTGVSSSLSPPDRAAPPMMAARRALRALQSEHERNITPSPRPISTGRLNTLPCLHLRPINVVIDHGPYLVDPVGALISEQASRLDAFSGYPFRRSQTSHAPGGTTGTRELRPSRSSRTRDGLLQSSYGDRG